MQQAHDLQSFPRLLCEARSRHTRQTDQAVATSRQPVQLRHAAPAGASRLSESAARLRGIVPTRGNPLAGLGEDRRKALDLLFDIVLEGGGMKIIRQGKYDGPETRPHRFVCKRCGCIWEADPGEFNISQMMGNDEVIMQDFTCRCPTCDALIYADK